MNRPDLEYYVAGFERLIAHHNELKPVYAELEGRKFLLQSLWPLLDMIIMTAAFHTDEDHAAIHDDCRELLIFNKGFSQVAARLVREARSCNRRHRPQRDARTAR